MRTLKLLAFSLTLVGASVSAEESLPFATTVASSQIVATERVLDGTVDAVNQTTVSAETSGVVEKIFYDVDDFVENDTVIVELKGVSQRASLDQAKAAEAETLARLRQAQAEYKRIKDIYARELVAKSQMDKAEAELKSAQARYKSAKANITQASEQADNTRVRAPYSGIVTRRHVELGEFVNVGQPLMTGVSLDTLRVNVDAPQRLINDIRSFRKARVVPSTDAQQGMAVKEMIIFPYAEAATKTFKVRLNLEQGATGLFPGMFVKVAFITGEESRLVIPQEAVAYRSEVTGVYVIGENQRPSLRQIRLGAKTEDGKITVLAGLDDGETIALNPVAAGIYLKRLHAEAKADD